MADLEHVTTHADDAVAELIGQYQDRPRIEALLRAIARQFQDIEDAAWDVFVQSALDTAHDNELDVIGKIVGQPRSGSGDDEYRVFLAARIKTNRSNGKANELLAIAALVLNDAPVRMRTYYPSAIVMSSDDVGVNALILWRDFLARAKGAAKTLQFGYSKQPSSNTIKRGSFYRGNALATTQRPGSGHSTTYGGGKTAGIFG